MNLEIILAFEEIWSLNIEIDESEKQVKFGFFVATVTGCRANFKKLYLTKLWLELSHSCAQIEASDV